MNLNTRPGFASFTLIILLIVLTVYFSLTLEIRAENNVIILSHTGYLDSQGNYYVVGEVQNIGNETVHFVTVEVAFYDSQGNLIDTLFDLTMLYKILPGRKSPFLIALFNLSRSAKVHHYTLTVSFKNTSPLPLGLEIISHEAQIDQQGQMRITGRVKNIGTKIAHNINVVATCYNANGNVVAAAQTDLDPIENNLNPDQIKSFEIIIPQERVPFIYTYELAVESNEYAIIPEFPLLTLILLLIFSLTTILIVCKRKLMRL